MELKELPILRTYIFKTLNIIWWNNNKVQSLKVHYRLFFMLSNKNLKYYQKTKQLK